jgi:SAM-dependent methyltransferase
VSEITSECQLCGSTGPHETISVREMMFGTRELFEYFSCAKCDSLQIVHVPDDEELARHYPPDYYSYDVSAQPTILRWLATQQDRYELRVGVSPVGALMTRMLPERIVRAVITGNLVKMLGKLGVNRDARILDVGCGGGALLDRLARVGFKNLAGADPFIPSDGATPLGVPLMKRYMSEVSGDYDLIMFNHSLEHVPDFIATLKAAYEKLAPGGCCLVRLPTTSSEVWDVYRADWVDIDAPRHIVVPSREGMALAADRVGLRVEKAYDDSTFFGFIASEAYRHDVELTDPKLFWKMLRTFGPREFWDWEKRAEQLNRQSRGDRVGFVLRAS